MAEPLIRVEVVYALAHKQRLLSLEVSPGTSMREAVLQSGLQAEFAELDLAHCPLGIFGKAVPKPEARVLQDGERVEIYRPLLADPKEVRKQRAAKAALAKAQEAL